MDIRNIAIIAHVDHGKTTLVDALLRQSDTKMNKNLTGTNCIMDSNELERERGITIFSKNASVVWKNTKINIIDTPGHADFGGEVERVLKMADGSLLLIDAHDGPMPQTRFVLKKALELKHKIIIVINMIDKKNLDINEVLNKTFDLFIDLGADDKTADSPVIYTSGKLGKAGLNTDLNSMVDISPLFEKIVSYIPPATGDVSKPLQMLVTSISRDNHKGRVARGRIYRGRIRAGQEVMHINRHGQMKKFRLTSLVTFDGLDKTEVKEAQAGEIVAVAGIPEITIGETIAEIDKPMALPLLAIEEPTVKMTFNVNSSPFAGKESTFVTSSKIKERLYAELDNDVALKVTDNPNGGWVVSGRGELHLAILIERLRREGYAVQVSQPQVIVKEKNGQKLIPYEEVYLEVPESYSGAVIQKLNSRCGEMKKMEVINGITHLEFVIPTQGLFGYRMQFMSDTHGLGVMDTIFHDYLPEKGTLKDREQGSLVAHETGITRIYGLTNVQDRGELFVGPNTMVYKGQVVGQNARSGDMHVNVCKEKQLSNMRSKGEGVSRHFNEPRIMELDDALDYIDHTELVDITPKAIRIRKIILDEIDERRKNKGILS
ncbi:MAG TPA: translational GTPase TypA [Candidatus Bathyarchaeia archaeon]|nr:translational GTPase TypA [Candidatus Bathyarchaeia archaeon]